METQVEEIVTAKNLWLETSKDKNYSFTLSTYWVGNSKPSSVHKIKVIGGKPSTILPQDVSTIEGLFTYTFEAIEHKELEVNVIYNKVYGYPMSVKVIIPNTIDGASTLRVTDFEFL